MDPKAVIELARESDCKFIDVKFQDLAGMWQHFSIPAKSLGEAFFVEGRCLEGTALRGVSQLASSCVRVVPDPATARLDPFPRAKTLSLIGQLCDPATGAGLPRDPRSIAARAEAHLKGSGIADEALFAPETEFFVLDDVRFDQSRNSGYYYIDSDEGKLTSSREESMGQGYRQQYREAYYPAPPADALVDVRQEMVEEMLDLGLPVAMEHHETNGAGQGGIDLCGAGPVAQGDNMLWLKYVAKNVARRHLKSVTFMPKPLAEEAGSGMPTALTFTRGGASIFGGDGYAGLSQTALWCVGGILKHAPALAAFVNPSTNSYRRLSPGFDAPINVAYSHKNRAVAVWTPDFGAPEKKTVKLRLPDNSANPYLAFSAILMAALDGVENKIDPGKPLDKEIALLTQEELSAVPVTPPSLEEALAALEEDYEFLLKGGVFSKEVIETWIELKMEGEIMGARSRPTPWEFALYFDC